MARTAASETTTPARDRLRASGAVLLVSCYELGHQPSGVTWPLAFLVRAGFRPATVDLSVETLDLERVSRAELVVFAVPMHTALRIGLQTLRHLRDSGALRPGAVICFHGHYAWMNRDHLASLGVDVILGGEAEEEIVELARSLDAGATYRGPAGPVRRRLDYPVPLRDTLPGLERYAHLDRCGELIPAGYVEASRGCKHHCRHCPIPAVYEGRFLAVPVEVVLADVERQVAAGAGHITFGDPDFLNGPRHAQRVVGELARRFPGLSFDFTAKVEHLLRRRELLPGFVEAGCAFVVSAVESLADPVLERLAKGHTAAEALELFDLASEVGLGLRPTFVSFTPWTSLEDYRDVLRAVAEKGLVGAVDPVQFAVRLLVPPGSRLLESSGSRSYFGELDPSSLSHRWSHPDPRMDALHEAVSERVEEDARLEVEPEVTIAAIAELAGLAAGVAGRRARPRTPRLTETWFC